jgi:hypothetical protein
MEYIALHVYLECSHVELCLILTGPFSQQPVSRILPEGSIPVTIQLVEMLQ